MNVYVLVTAKDAPTRKAAANAVMRFGAGIGMLRDSVGASVEHSGEPAVFEAIKKLGLRLESRKTPVEMIVVDRIEKSPTEN